MGLTQCPRGRDPGLRGTYIKLSQAVRSCTLTGNLRSELTRGNISRDGTVKRNKTVVAETGSSDI
jgi:hypothetical protein